MVGLSLRRLGLGLQRQAAATPAAPDFFVDSVGGSDANDGLTADTAFQTLGAVPWATGIYAALFSGSTWLESLDQSATDNLTIKRHGTGNLPIIDGSDAVASWTAEGTANVWQATVAHDATGTNGSTRRGTVYEDGELLTRVADVATCSSTPGSFVDIKASDGTPWTVKIHPSDSLDPNSNGKAYRVSTRNIGVIVDTGGTLEGIRAQRVISNNGAIEAHTGAAISQCLAVDGTKHNLLIGSGSLTDVIACRIDRITSYEPGNTFFVGFTPDADGLSMSVTRCAAILDDPGATVRGNTYTQHDSVGNYYASFIGRQLWNVDAQIGWSPTALVVDIEGMFSRDANQPFNVSGNTVALKYAQVRQGASTVGMSSSGVGTSPTITISHMAVYSLNSTTTFFRPSGTLNGATVSFEHCVFYMAGARAIMLELGWTSGLLKCNNCLFVYPSGDYPIRVPTGVEYEGDNNVFLPQTANNLRCRYHGTDYSNIAGWRTATGQDGNSVQLLNADLGTLFSGTVANGDFRLAATGAGAQAAALLAGPQQHWDWNARAVASGPPIEWPNVPATLADAETYCEDPTAWVF